VPAKFGLPATCEEDFACAVGWSDGVAPGKGPAEFWADALFTEKSVNSKSAAAHKDGRLKVTR
jgi:hypothetical protein